MALLPTGWIKMPGDNDETKRFAWSHVKSIFYNKAANILLKDKLDEMDKIIDEKIAKAIMSNVQVNDQSKIPTSALAYAMQQSITKNGQDIAKLNSDLTISDAKMAVERNSKGVYLMLRNKITNNRLSLLLDEGTKKLVLDSEISGEWTGADPIITKSDLANKTKSGVATISTKQNDSTALQIQFDEPFPSRPYVTVSLNADNANTNTKISVFGIDQTGFKVSIYDTAATTRRIEWIASV